MTSDRGDGHVTRQTSEGRGSPLATTRHRSSSSVGDDRERSASLSAENERAPLAESDLVSANDPPPLPDEAPPADDGWDAIWDESAQAFYFYNRFTQVIQWENPRISEANTASHGSYDRYANNGAPGTTSTSGPPGTSSPPRSRAGGYNPAIHGDYDPNADYAQDAQKEEEEEHAAVAAAAAAAAGLPDPNKDYAATGHFNRFTGRFQDSTVNPELHNDENKSRRQMSAFFDVDAAANSHDGRSLKAERRGKALSKKELKAYKDRRREKKEEKRRAWLRD